MNNGAVENNGHLIRIRRSSGRVEHVTPEELLDLNRLRRERYAKKIDRMKKKNYVVYFVIIACIFTILFMVYSAR